MANRSRVFLKLIILLVSFSGLALAENGADKSVQGLIYDLEHPEMERRKKAASLLGKNQVHEAVPGLIELTEDPEPSVRLEAVEALVKINDNRALPALVRMTRDPQDDIKEKAIEGIVNIYVVDEEGFVQGLKKVINFVNPLDDDFNPVVVEPYVPVSQESTNALADLLFHEDDDIREQAATALGILRAQSTLPALQDALERENDSDVQVELIRSIYKIGDPSAGRSLLPLIRDPDKKVHDEAIFAVGRLKVEEAVPQLNELYRAGIEERRKLLGIVPVTGSDDLQKKLLEALAHIGHPSSEEIFVDALTDERDFYRRSAAEGLGRGGDTSYVTMLARQYLREESEEVRLAMSFALYNLGREEHLIELIDNARNQQAYNYLLELNTAEVKNLYPYVRTEKDSIKVKLLDVIGLKGDVSGLNVAQEMTQHEDTEVASAANLAIRRIQGRHPHGS